MADPPTEVVEGTTWRMGNSENYQDTNNKRGKSLRATASLLQTTHRRRDLPLRRLLLPPCPRGLIRSGTVVLIVWNSTSIE